MGFRLIQNNLLDCDAEAILLTIDGAASGMEGNITRAFARRWPDAGEEVEEQIVSPVPLGRSLAIPLDPGAGCPFKLVVIASTLHHADVLADERKRLVISSALREAMSLAIRSGCGSLATAVMSGGWRIPLATAFEAMLQCYSVASSSGVVVLDLRVCAHMPKQFAQLSELAAHPCFVGVPVI